MLFAFLTALAERTTQQEFGKIGEVLWWWMSTVSTVGYGDLYPQTALGKMFTGVVMISSFLILGLVIAEFNLIIRNLSNQDILGLRKISSKNHIVILGDNSLINPIINYLSRSKVNKELVLVTDAYTENPYVGIKFVMGDPKNLDVLKQANIEHASLAIILANDKVNNPDAYTLVIANEIEKLNKKITTIGEMTDNELKSVFAKANLDFFISEKKLIQGINHEDQISKLIMSAINKSNT